MPELGDGRVAKQEDRAITILSDLVGSRQRAQCLTQESLQSSIRGSLRHRRSVNAGQFRQVLDTQIERIGKKLWLNDGLTRGTEFFGETYKRCGNGGHRRLQVNPTLNFMLLYCGFLVVFSNARVDLTVRPLFQAGMTTGRARLGGVYTLRLRRD